MSMIATDTEEQACKKLCPKMMVQDECKGSRCMAWQWAKSARLSCSTSLLRSYAESAFDGYQGNDDPEMPDLDAANFYQPVGDGWRFSTFEAGDDGWEAHWERDSDPEQQGYCAALPWISLKKSSPPFTAQSLSKGDTNDNKTYLT